MVTWSPWPLKRSKNTMNSNAPSWCPLEETDPKNDSKWWLGSKFPQKFVSFGNQLLGPSNHVLGGWFQDPPIPRIDQRWHQAQLQKVTGIFEGPNGMVGEGFSKFFPGKLSGGWGWIFWMSFFCLGVVDLAHFFLSFGMVPFEICECFREVSTAMETENPETPNRFGG